MTSLVSIEDVATAITALGFDRETLLKAIDVAAPKITPWKLANNGSGPRIWFLYRDLPEGRQYVETATGNVRRFTLEKAEAEAGLLNRKLSIAAATR